MVKNFNWSYIIIVSDIQLRRFEMFLGGLSTENEPSVMKLCNSTLVL